MRKKEAAKIRLKDVTICYGQTTLQEFLRHNYSVKETLTEYHEESSTAMCGFYRNGGYVGELVFFDIPAVKYTADLYDKPISLVLLDDESIKKETFWDFMEFTGKNGRKDIKFLCFFYLFAWLMIALCYKEIPAELIWATALLPAGFFGSALLFYGIKTLLGFLFRKLERVPFIISCTVIFVVWTCLITYTFREIKIADYKLYDVPLTLIPALLSIITAVFLSYQIIVNWWLDKEWYKWKEKTKKYLPLHLLLYSSIYLIIVNKDHLTSFLQEKSFLSDFLFFFFLQFMMYCILSVIVWFRMLFMAVFSFNLKRK